MPEVGQSENSTTAPVKKGRKVSWKPANKLGFLSAPEGYTPRWCDSNESNLMKKQEEGFEFLNKTKFPQLKHTKKDGAKEIADGAETGLVKYREMVAMMIPNETRDARNDYFKKLNEDQLKAKIMMKDAKRELGSAGNSLTLNKITID